MEPTTLLEAVEYFKVPANCRAYLVPRRWANGIVKCPHCGSERVTFSEKHNRWQCAVHHDRRQFTLKTGTIMEDSPIGLDKWLPAIWLASATRNGISSWELHRAIKVTQKTAWFMLGRIRLAMQDEANGGKLSGELEADESFIGGKARNMHNDVLARKITGRGTEGKAIVAAVLQRGGKIRAQVMDTRKKKDLHSLVREHAEAGSNLYTDALKSYEGLDEFTHQVIDHAVAYLDGQSELNRFAVFGAERRQ